MRLLLALMTLPVIASCALTQPPPAPAPTKVIDTGCQWAKPFQVSKDDTTQTKQAALAAWKTFHKNCPGQ
jgi:hypothetical protein